MAARKHKTHSCNEPVLAALEDGLAVLELAFGRAERPESRPVDKVDPLDKLVNLVAVRTGVPIDGTANGAGNAGQRMHAFQRVLDRQVHERLQASARIGLDPPVPELEAIRRVAHDQPPKAFIGRNDVAPVTQQAERNAHLSGGKKASLRAPESPARANRSAGPPTANRVHVFSCTPVSTVRPLIRERRSAKARAA